jgi:prenylcysteine oxidase/farnesylcysteine lyase
MCNVLCKFDRDSFVKYLPFAYVRVVATSRYSSSDPASVLCLDIVLSLQQGASLFCHSLDYGLNIIKHCRKAILPTMKTSLLFSTLLIPLRVLSLQSQLPLHDTFYTPPVHRVAIIGAGAAGSSAAYHLSQYAAEFGHPLNIKIYELNPRAGGRTTTVDAFDNPAYPTELGGSIFVKINHILYNAAEDFGLSTSSANNFRPKESDYAFGIWDGAQFVYKQVSGSGRWSGYWDVVKLLWRYGMAPIRTQRMSKESTGKFLKMYDPPVFPFEDLTQAVEELELTEYTNTTGASVLEEGGAGGAFAREIVQASTRVNYAQNLGQIHGLEGLVCMAIEGAVAVEGGNWQIFEEMVKRSGAKAVFNSLVTDITAHDNGTYTVQSKHAVSNNIGQDGHFDTADAFSASSQQAHFDTIIMATPLQFSNITLHPLLSDPPDPVSYVTLHVTLFTSPHRLSPAFFGLEDQKYVPEAILTTLPEGVDLGNARGVDAVGPAGFWSISTLRSIRPAGSAETQYLYKIFSPAPVTGSWLSSILGFPYQNTGAADPLSDLNKEDVSWMVEKVWQSYPYEVPRREFGSVRYDWGETGHMWYTSGIESFISTMETSALMGRNVARLVAERGAMRRVLGRVEEVMGGEK